MAAWRYVAQRALTGEILEWEVPLERDELNWALSGAGALRGTITPDVGLLRASDGGLVLDEWGTLIYAEADGEIRWGGILISSAFEGEAWTIEAAGFVTYPHGIPYGDIFSKIDVDPLAAFREIWRHVQAHPDGDLNVMVAGEPTPVRLGVRAFAEDREGRYLDFAIPSPQWGQLYRHGWVGGPVRKWDVDPALWVWLLDHGFVLTDDITAVPPTTWGEQFHWWESALLNKGWRGGPVFDGDIDGDLETFLVEHGWAYSAEPEDEADSHRLYSPADNDGVLPEGARVVEAQPYELLWWETPDCGEEIDSLAKQAPFDFVERHFWTPDGPVDHGTIDPDLWEWLIGQGWTGRDDQAERIYPPPGWTDQIAHIVRVGYPRLGRRRDDLTFVQDANVIEVVSVRREGDEFANQVNGLGAGEGITAVRREIAVRDGRLRRVYTHTDKGVTDSARMGAIVADELAHRQAITEISSITVRDHKNAPLGAWSLGDDILVQATIPWLGDVALWCRVTGWSLLGEDTAVLTLVRSDTLR